MAFAALLRQHAVPLAGLTTALAVYPKRTALAEEPPSPENNHRLRKPIYETPYESSPRDTPATTPVTSSQTEQPQDTSSRSPSPTDRLAEQVKVSRLFVHRYAVQAEDAVNRAMDRFMDAEHSFTSTIASLAPRKETNEKVLPGAIYVLVATMAGSIVSRNRNIALRFATPLVAGVVAAHYVVPNTTQNVGNLIWSYEERVPVLRDNHLRIEQGIRHFLETGKAHSQMGLAMAEERVHDARKSVEDWVKSGR